MMAGYRRIGQVVLSADTVQEAELQAMLEARRLVYPADYFTLHSSRVPANAGRTGLERVDRRQFDLCREQLSDARVDIVTCFDGWTPALPVTESCVDVQEGIAIPVVFTSEALLDALRLMDAERIALVMPESPRDAQVIVECFAGAGFEVADWAALDVAAERPCRDFPAGRLPDVVDHLSLAAVDVVVLSTSPALPALPAIAQVEAETGRPVVTAMTATVHMVLRRLGMVPVVPGAGALLSGARHYQAGARRR
ncbi:Asp/Glu racemase [Burkholderia cenocepacia]|nr:Asp/Glu racemase [Burkholderia cenocepacia]